MYQKLNQSVINFQRIDVNKFILQKPFRYCILAVEKIPQYFFSHKYRSKIID